jgi:putative acetyltransferase
VESLRRNCGDILSLVAVDENRVVGHVLFSPAELEGGGKRIKGMGLAPMAVLPEYQRKGIGSKLVEKGIEHLVQNGCPFIVVLGYARFYPRFGFEPARRGIRSAWDVPDEGFMILVLDGSMMQGIRGIARYRPEFEEAM